MKMNLDDPNLTAYALGELSGPARAEMERVVAQSIEAQAFVRETQQLATLLETEFATELNSATPRPRNLMPMPEARSFWSDARWLSIGLAAVLAIGAVVAAVALSERRSVIATGPSAAPDYPDVIMEMEAVPPVIATEAGPSAVGENAFVSAAENPFSAFALQVGGESFTEVRRQLERGQKPPRDAVQIEELVNAFAYNYPQPTGPDPFSINLEVAGCPWEPAHRLVRIGLQGRVTGGNEVIARDATVQVEFQPTAVANYRLLGYEKRAPASRRNELAGVEISSEHCITALYEVVPSAAAIAGSDLVTVRLHYREPGGRSAAMLERSLADHGAAFGEASADFRFAAAVAEFGMILRDSPHRGNGTLAGVLEAAQEASERDTTGDRADFVGLVRQAQALAF